MPSAVPAKCAECARLFEVHTSAERMIMSLVEAQFEAFPGEDAKLLQMIDEALATARRDRDRATQALREHRREHDSLW
jgi:hypothetical protein